MKAFKAYSSHGWATAETPRAAAEKFFSDFPSARKCSIIEGVVNGKLFSTTYGPGEWPKSWKDVTRKTLADLPH